MKKRVFIIHGWDGHPEEGWIPWLKQNLEKEGFEVHTPAMPNAAEPQMNEWLNHLKKIVRKPGENCFFVGHSLGCITILRYLESLDPESKIGGATLVAGFTSNLGYQELDNFFTNQRHVNWEKMKSVCPNVVAIHSDNDPFVSTHYGEEFFQEYLGARYILLHNKMHFSGSEGIKILPEALESVINFAK